jgi:hypothetical protein
MHGIRVTPEHLLLHEDNRLDTKSGALSPQWQSNDIKLGTRSRITCIRSCQRFGTAHLVTADRLLSRCHPVYRAARS